MANYWSNFKKGDLVRIKGNRIYGRITKKEKSGATLKVFANKDELEKRY
jgi:hypothetical protein